MCRKFPDETARKYSSVYKTVSPAENPMLEENLGQRLAHKVRALTERYELHFVCQMGL